VGRSTLGTRAGIIGDGRVRTYASVQCPLFSCEETLSMDLIRSHGTITGKALDG